ncbi:DUF5977 domain-containing protein [Chryseobacterium rhizosphaerae]|jgi:hypothetical protein|uniref:DUF5977 domain-containing protein n=1 Tax=Chryseobacterium rhizosphaerae TaxID=395937 RepID=A0ABX9IEL9_9FLAO|nr:DUF5977 domain-containing protein [Chryseobacterium rhizosphaerae]REC70818.1 hypothetical protein DRF57_21560 [Chryseobacterium rhizosphaerae]GEN68109.1 hypothetical protein CRH01_26770 [Chryseobacterium rhizosphaerae]
MRKLLVFAITHFFLLFYCQEFHPSDNYFSLEKQVNSNVNPNSGLISESIGLLSIPLRNGQNYSIAATYTSAPFNPILNTSVLGLNWDLDVSGIITKSWSQYNAWGPYYAYEDSWNDGITNVSDYDMWNAIPALQPNNLNSPYPLERSKYYFKFWGYKGYFYIDRQGNPKIYSTDANLKISLTEYNYKTKQGIINNGCDTGSSIIKITDDKGNEFWFGGNDNYLDTSYSAGTAYPLNNTGNSRTERHVYISAWYLNKILLSTGDKIVFENKDNNMKKTFSDFCTISRQYTENRQKIMNDSIYVQKTLGYSQQGLYTKIGNNFISHSKGLQEDKNIVKKSLLNRIIINDTYFVNVNYSRINYTDTVNDFYIKNLIVTYKNKPVKRVDFTLDSFGDVNKRTFLTNIKMGADEYEFKYYKTDKFPSLDTYATDIYGYYNGMNDKGYDLDNIDDRDTQSPYFNTGLLKSIEYPTRSRKVFTYERSDFSKVHGKLPNTGDIGVYNSDGIINYPRIQKIQHFDSNHFQIGTDRTFKYTKNNISTGIFEDEFANAFRAYETMYYLGYLSTDPNQFIMVLNNFNSKSSSNIPINYSYVEETDGKGSIQYFFTDRTTNKDTLVAKYKKAGQFESAWMPYGGGLNIYTYKGAYSRAHERGNLLKKIILNQTQDTIQVTNYKYKSLLNQNLLDNGNIKKLSDDFIIKTTPAPGYIVQNFNIETIVSKQFTEPYKLSSTEVINYYGNNKNSSKEELTYSSYLKNYNTVANKLNSSNGTSNLVKLSYPSDFGTQYNSLIDKNIVAVPIKITKEKNNLPIATTIFEYTQSSSSNILNLYKQFSGRNNDPSNTNKVLKKTNDLYDNKNNLIQYTDNEASTKVAIYGYNQTLPIALIEGATYAELMQIFGLDPANTQSYLNLDIVKKSDLDVDTATEIDLFSTLDAFRKVLGNKNYQITTYTQDPLVGVTRVTLPSGVTEVYKYNKDSKLEKIQNEEGSLLKKYKYHYAAKKYYNQLYSKVFIRTNCPTWQIGEPYTYIVPENKYMSYISQTDADQMAKNEANSNGQNAANTLGSCSMVSCNFVPNYYVNMYYSSIQQTGPNHIKVTMQFQANPPNGMSWTSGSGVSVGYIGEACRPLTAKYINYTSGSSSWSISIDQSGYVMVRSNNGTAPGNGMFGFSVEYDKN